MPLPLLRKLLRAGRLRRLAGAARSRSIILFAPLSLSTDPVSVSKARVWARLSAARRQPPVLPGRTARARASRPPARWRRAATARSLPRPRTAAHPPRRIPPAARERTAPSAIEVARARQDRAADAVRASVTTTRTRGAPGRTDRAPTFAIMPARSTRAGSTGPDPHRRAARPNPTAQLA